MDVDTGVMTAALAACTTGVNNVAIGYPPTVYELAIRELEALCGCDDCRTHPPNGRR